MRIAILGPNGQLGGDLADALADAGITEELELIGRDRLDVADPALVSPALNRLDFDTLINCTGYHKTDEVEDNADRAFRVNAFAVGEMARVCAARGARLIHFSTDYVFDGLSRSTPYSEDHPSAPLNVYGASKLMGEALARAACARTTVFRVASLFGVRGASGKGGNFVETMIRLGREKGHLKVVDDIVMSPTSTADIAGWVVEYLHRDGAPGLYHAVNSGGATWCEFARRIIAAVGVKAEVEAVGSDAYPTRARRPAYSRLDNAQLAAVIGPFRPWEAALSDYLRTKGYTG